MKSNDIGITTFVKLFMVKTYLDLYGSRLMVGNILGIHISLSPTFLRGQMPNKLKSWVICSCFQICDSLKIYASMNKIDWGMEVSKHITLETKMVVTIHLIYIPSTNFHCCYEITHKCITWLGKFDQWMNCFQEWHNDIQP